MSLKKRTIDVVVAYEPTPSVSKKFAMKLTTAMSGFGARGCPSRASRIRPVMNTYRYPAANTPRKMSNTVIGFIGGLCVGGLGPTGWESRMWLANQTPSSAGVRLISERWLAKALTRGPANVRRRFHRCYTNHRSSRCVEFKGALGPLATL